MKTCFTTTVSADYYQEYIPLYCLALRTWYKDDIVFFIRGEMSKTVEKAIKDIPNLRIIQNVYCEYPNNISTTNALRFIGGESILSEYDFSIITDADLLILVNPWPYHLHFATPAHPFSGYHGALSKPHRPEVCPSWTGNFERVAGGYFCITPDWLVATSFARTKYGLALMDGRAGLYREEDEVILARILKESGFQVPPSKYYPPDLRGIHLGDFKFDHRWQNINRMKTLISDLNINLFLKFAQTKEWKECLETLQSENIIKIISRLITHIKARRALE
jgi:hypothetical protein